MSFSHSKQPLNKWHIPAWLKKTQQITKINKRWRWMKSKDLQFFPAGLGSACENTNLWFDTFWEQLASVWAAWKQVSLE